MDCQSRTFLICNALFMVLYLSSLVVGDENQPTCTPITSGSSNYSTMLCFDNTCISANPINTTSNGIMCHMASCLSYQNSSVNVSSHNKTCYNALAVCYAFPNSTGANLTASNSTVCISLPITTSPPTTAPYTGGNGTTSVTPVNNTSISTTAVSGGTTSNSTSGSSTTASSGGGGGNWTTTSTSADSSTAALSTTAASSTAAPSTTTASGESPTTTTVSYKFDASYTETITQSYPNKEAARAAFCNATRVSLNIEESKIRNCDISAGSIIVTFELYDTKENAKNYVNVLHTKVQAGSISVAYNNTFSFSVITSQTILMDGSGYTGGSGGSNSGDDDEDSLWIVLMVVFIVLALIFLVIVLVYVFVIRKNKQVTPSDTELGKKTKDNNTDQNRTPSDTELSKMKNKAGYRKLSETELSEKASNNDNYNNNNNDNATSQSKSSETKMTEPTNNNTNHRQRKCSELDFHHKKVEQQHQKPDEKTINTSSKSMTNVDC